MQIKKVHGAKRKCFLLTADAEAGWVAVPPRWQFLLFKAAVLPLTVSSSLLLLHRERRNPGKVYRLLLLTFLRCPEWGKCNCARRGGQVRKAHLRGCSECRRLERSTALWSIS